MNVYTYYEPVEGFAHPTALLDLWIRSWEKRGWSPVVLGRKEAEQSKLFADVYAAAKNQPTYNASGYTMACKLRYCALEIVGGGLLTDYDVINYGFSFDMLKEAVVGYRILRFNGGGFVYMTYRGALRFCEDIIDWSKGQQLCYMIEGVPGISDMCMMQLRNVPLNPAFCALYGEPGWQAMPVVHYSNGSMPGGKAELIQQVRPI